MLSAKIVLQDLCRRKLDWDKGISSSLPVQPWLEGLPALEKFLIRCCYKPVQFGEITSFQTHHFSDTLELANGTASYMIFTNEDANIHFSLLLSKSHLTPLKVPSIPHLEDWVPCLLLSSLIARFVNSWNYQSHVLYFGHKARPSFITLAMMTSFFTRSSQVDFLWSTMVPQLTSGCMWTARVIPYTWQHTVYLQMHCLPMN